MIYMSLSNNPRPGVTNSSNMSFFFQKKKTFRGLLDDASLCDLDM